MGCGATTKSKVTTEWNEQFFALKLSTYSVWQVRCVFLEIDTSRSGYINLFDICSFVDIEITTFIQRVFTLNALNDTGSIDFREFLISTWNICTLKKGSLGMLFL